MLTEGDVVTLDLALSLNGYCVDTARTVPIGRVATVAGRLLQVTKQTLDLAIQNVRLFATMTVHDNLLVGDTPLMRTGLLRAGLALPSARREERGIEDKVARVAELLGFRPYLHRIAGDLPYGLQKLVELGRALMPDPRLVLLDEPVAGMNPTDKQALIAALSRVRQSREVSFLLVEHDMNFVMNLAEHLYVLNFGKLIAEGSPERIQADPAVIAAYLGGAGRADH